MHRPQALFKQLFSFMNVQLFNQLLLRRECCSFSNGEYVKTGLLQVRGGGLAVCVRTCVCARIRVCAHVMPRHAHTNGALAAHRPQVENWLQLVGPEHSGDSWEELRYIRQARAVWGP